MSKVRLYACSIRFRIQDDTVKQSVFTVFATSQEEAKHKARMHVEASRNDDDEYIDEFLTARAQEVPDEVVAEAAGYVAERMLAKGVKPITDAERTELHNLEAKRAGVHFQKHRLSNLSSIMR